MKKKLIPKVLLFLALIIYSLFAFNFFSGNVGFYNSSAYHALTSISLLNGHLSLPINPSGGIPNDLQFFGGKIYTQWGYGVAIAQMPFNAILFFLNKNLAFPDVLIFIFYLLVTANTCFDFIKSEFSDKFDDLGVVLITFVWISLSLGWLISYRFIQYEETPAYYVLFSVLTFIFYIRTIKTSVFINTFLLCTFMILLLMIRQTSLIIIALISLDIFSRRRKFFLKYLACLAPYLSVFFYINYLKTGSLIGTGVHNTNPGIPQELPFIKMGRPCQSISFDIAIDRLILFFKNIFVGEFNLDTFILNDCFIFFEDAFSFGRPYVSYYLSAALAIYYFYLFIRFKKSTIEYFNLIPFIGITITFFAFTFSANGFAYRYFVDFYFFYLLCIFYLIKEFDLFKIKYRIYLYLVCIYLSFLNANLIYSQSHTVKFSQVPVPIFGYKWDYNFSYPAIRECIDNKIFEKDKLGWGQNCEIVESLNTYISIPDKSLGSGYKLILEGENIPESLMLRINGILLKDFKWKDSFITLNSTESLNYNIFIYFPNNTGVVLNRLYLK